MHGEARQRPDLSERVKRKIFCGNAWRESRIERHYPTKKRMGRFAEIA